MAISQREMEFIEAQRYTKEEICGAYGVPPVLVGDLRQSTFNNFQQAKASFWDETLIPELELIEAEINDSLMPLLSGPHPNPLPRAGEGAEGPRSRAGEGEGGERLVARFDLSGVSSLREDAGARARRHLQLVQAGILTINEVRAKEGLEPVPWGRTGRTPPSRTALSSAGLGDARWAAAPRLLFRPHPNPLPRGRGGRRRRR